MKFQPYSPGFVDGWDAILAADRALGATTFARRRLRADPDDRQDQAGR